mmetsp:Transcript_60404/g.112848  ORF Transcript_60404/g.112848 Transcript_60404/m.112848 type:complete len:303 (-) Transcript_60404:143-1051(-)
MASGVDWSMQLLKQAQGWISERLDKLEPDEVLVETCCRFLETCEDETGAWEFWLCAFDKVVASLEPFQVEDWPLLMQVLVAVENMDAEEADHFVYLAWEIDQRAEREIKEGTRSEASRLAISRFTALLRLRGTWLGAVLGEIQTIEELYDCIASSVSTKPRPSGRTPSGPRDFSLEEAIDRAEKALRSFAWDLTSKAWTRTTSNLKAGEAKTPLPARSEISQELRNLEAAFPLRWLVLGAQELLRGDQAYTGLMARDDAAPEKSSSSKQVMAKRKAQDPKPAASKRRRNAASGLRVEAVTEK